MHTLTFYFVMFLSSFSSAHADSEKATCEALNPASGAYSNCLADRKLVESMRIAEGDWVGLETKLPPPAREALKELRVAASAFFAHAAEVDQIVILSGTARESFVTEARIVREKAFFTEVSGFTAKPPKPLLSVLDVEKADVALNAAYATTTKACEKEVDSRAKFPVPQDYRAACTKVKKMQLSWIRYRDAWRVFAATMFGPALGAEKMEAHSAAEQTRKQAKFLSGIVYEERG